jgi:hypothetical protein
MREHEKKFVKRAILFVLIASSPLIPEIISFNNPYTFRVWEAITTHNFNLDRPFYVDRTIHKIEEGDLGYRTKYAVKKDVIWHTDEWGYRNNAAFLNYDIVIMGDSNIAGSTLSQNQTFANSLMEISNFSVYSYSPADINKYLSEKRFIDNPPKIIILASIEREIYDLPKINQPQNIKSNKNLLFAEKIEDCFDQMLKLSFYREILAKITGLFFHRDLIVNDKTNMLFLKTALDSRTHNLDNFSETISIIKEYNDYFSDKNIRFIFLPIPDKESVYSAQLPEEYKEYRKYNNYLPKLITELKGGGVEVIDIYTSFTDKNDFMFYNLDDTHWNYNAVKLTSNISLKIINNPIR